jgi:hypothetical protein
MLGEVFALWFAAVVVIVIGVVLGNLMKMKPPQQLGENSMKINRAGRPLTWEDICDIVDTVSLRFVKVEAVLRAIAVGEDGLDLEQVIPLVDMAEDQAHAGRRELQQWFDGLAREE